MADDKLQQQHEKVAKVGRLSLPKLHARIMAPKVDVQADSMPNRLALLLDCSGSMDNPAGQGAARKPKIQHLRDAVAGFLTCVDFSNTSVALESIPLHDQFRVPLSRMVGLLQAGAASLDTVGSTPMGETMDYVLRSYPVTRAILVSDGEPTDGSASLDCAKHYAESETPVDCVHIGESSQGEEHLKRIAEMTGGVYIKFTDVGAFGKAFKYLTPGFRGMLTSGQVTASDIGATEVK